MFVRKKIIFICGLLFIVLFIQLRNFTMSSQEVVSPLIYFKPPNVVVFDNFSIYSLNESRTEIEDLIKLKNIQQNIINWEKFGPVTEDTLVITIQIHDRISYLYHLIQSLRTAKDISKVLLITSHDVYNEAINEMIESINFCMVLQIFFPFSIQTHPSTFPGDSPDDCPRDISMEDARRIKCLNYKNPDHYGHYREAKFTQIKHHVWWKLNRIFEQLDVTKDFNGFVLILEEDYYLAEDFLHFAKLLQATTLEKCSRCNILSLGGYRNKIERATYDKIDFLPWISYRHNMGMMFNRTTWNEVKKCSKYFCDYDDYNYDWSLQNVNRNCLEKKLFVSIARGPRVFHLGECGVHHSAKNCEPDDQLKLVDQQLSLARKRKLLFPKKLKQSQNELRLPNDELTPNGGWGDLRDRRLCHEITKGLVDLSIVDFN